MLKSMKKKTLSCPDSVFYRDWPKVLGFEVATNTVMHNADDTQDTEDSLNMELTL